MLAYARENKRTLREDCTYRKKISFKSRLDILIYKQEYYNFLREILVLIRLNLYRRKYYFCLRK